ncbi:MAG: Na+/H+ antiporter subunit E [Anaerolineae bacterium]|nr:Na+/H+ antiporter subunit E [Anaerolineae bacterium]
METIKRIARYLILALPLGIVWLILTGVISIESFLVGYAVSIVVIMLGVRSVSVDIDLSALPLRAWLLVRYSLFMFWQIALASFDVSLRVFNFKPVKAGIIAVPIGDDTGDEIIGGASAHSITITPGEMVVAYDKDCKIMYVHCIDIDQSGKTLDSAQANRLAYFKRILNK